MCFFVVEQRQDEDGSEWNRRGTVTYVFNYQVLLCVMEILFCIMNRGGIEVALWKCARTIFYS